jgi:1-deoxy-D-xylulose 5-phosphate reductoisomerase
MKSIARCGRFAFISLGLIMMAACAGQKQPAQKLLADIEVTVTAAAAEAAKYVPDQLMDVQTRFAKLKASFDKQDYAVVISEAPAVLGAAGMLATAAAAKKDEVLKALNDKWMVLAGTVPESMTAVQNRIDTLRKKSKHPAVGMDLDTAKSSLDEAASLWSKAQAAFAGGNMDEAVRTAQDVKIKVDAVAATLKLDLAAPAARP